MNKKITLILPVFNAKHYLNLFLESLFKYTSSHLYRLIAIDNGSTDGVREILSKLEPEHSVIYNDRNLNYSGACNLGAKSSETDYLIFLNSDLILLPNWLEPIFEKLEEFKGEIVIGNKHLFPNSNRIHHGGVRIKPDALSEHHLLHSYAYDIRSNYFRDFTAVNAACLGIGRETFFRLGGFSEDFVNGCEDIDLCFKAKKKEIKVAYEPKSTVYHFGQSSPTRNDCNASNEKLLREQWQDYKLEDVINIENEDSKFVGEYLHKLRNQTNIAILSTYNQECGIATHTEQLRFALDRIFQAESHNVQNLTILAEATNIHTAIDDPLVFRCWQRFSENFSLTKSIIKELNIAVLHIQYQDGIFHHTDLLGLISWCSANNVKTVLTLHSAEDKLHLASCLINKADISFCHMNQALIRFVGNGANAQKIQVIPHGIRDDRYLLPSNIYREKLGIPSNTKLICSLGFIDEHKGIIEIIKSTGELWAEGCDITYIHLGRCHPNNSLGEEYLKKCRELVLKLNLADRVILINEFISEETASEFIGASDLVVLNYQIRRNEFSGAGAFTLSHLRPTITNNTEAFQDFGNITLQLSDKLNLTSAIKLLIDNDRLVTLLGKNCKKYIQTNSFTVLAKRLIKTYRELLLVNRVKSFTASEVYTYTGKKLPNLTNSPSLTIGFDGRALTCSSSADRGIGKYTLNHLKSLLRYSREQNLKVFIYDGEEHPHLQELKNFPNLEILPLSKLEQSTLDIFHISDPMSILPNRPTIFDLLPRTVNKVTVLFHDLIPIVKREHHFDRYSPSVQQDYLKRIETIKQRQFTVLTNSETTRNDLIKIVGANADLVRTIYAGLNHTARETTLDFREMLFQRLGINKNFLLSVGGLDPHKGFRTSIEAYAELKKTYDLQLVVVGSLNDPYKVSYFEALKSDPFFELIFTGYLKDQELSALYKNAVALLYPSEYEGFGFPALEAMAHGCPVIAGDCPALVEVLGDAGLFVHPKEPQQIVQRLQKIINSALFRENIVNKGLARARLFSWEETARRTFAAWEETGVIRFNDLRELFFC
jgi:glycosyltransferase involved in cell wall biosynthesis/GT2 family glycosyltransferase